MLEKKSHRALFYSLAVFPGAGLWLLGEKRRALIFILPSSLITLLMLKKVMQITQDMMQKMLDGLMPFDFINLFLEIRRDIYANPDIQHYLIILLAAWILGGLSTYFVSKKQEKGQ